MLDPGELTLVVGAGVSVPAPTSAPDFRALRNLFLSLADPELDTSAYELNQLSPEQIFDAVDDGREAFRAAVRRELWWLCEPNEPNANHAAVAALLGRGACVWTPNFDTMIERAAARVGGEIATLVPGSSVINAQTTELRKPHGSFPRSGDPPTEPASHHYELLFQASRVWAMQDDWNALLQADICGRDVMLFGYRGADPDLTPALLSAFAEARSVHWWEFPGTDNYSRLQ